MIVVTCWPSLVEPIRSAGHIPHLVGSPPSICPHRATSGGCTDRDCITSAMRVDPHTFRARPAPPPEY
jgi:hypothetical protein